MTQPLSGQVVLSSTIEGVDTTGTVATFTDTNIGDTAADFTATVNWGDGWDSRLRGQPNACASSKMLAC